MDSDLILIVEDEQRLARVLSDYLTSAGFRTELFSDGRPAVEAARQLRPAAILLDVMLPGLDGLAVCRQIRAFSQVPILMTTARVEEIDRLLGLELGADDYICKPYSPREILARVQLALRRSQMPAKTSPLRLDEAALRVSADGVRLDLTNTEFRLLKLMMAQSGRVFSRAQLLDLAYDPDQDVSDRVIDSHVKNLRKKLAQLLPGRELIGSVYGVGYRFESA